MYSADLLAKLRELMDECLEVARMKNADYATSDDAFANFKLCEVIAGIPTEQGMYVRMTDKIARIGHLLTKEAAVKTESLEDALSDLANYALLLRVYLEHKRG
jgi:hypothetical protein